VCRRDNHVREFHTSSAAPVSRTAKHEKSNNGNSFGLVRVLVAGYAGIVIPKAFSKSFAVSSSETRMTGIPAGRMCVAKLGYGAERSSYLTTLIHGLLNVS